MNLDVFWRQIVNLIMEDINQDSTDSVYEQYLKDTSLAELNNNIATILVKLNIAKILFEKEPELFTRAFKKYTGENVTCRFMMVNEYYKGKADEQNIKTFDDSLISKFTFDNFVVGPSNREAYAAALSCALNPSNPVFNPIFIYGDSGLGKTHLLNAIGNYLKNSSENIKIRYIPCSNFVNETVMALREKRIDEFKTRMNALDVLLVDDIQAISGKEKSIEVFFGIYNELYNNHKLIVLTSDRVPDMIKDVESRLISRFNQGLSVTISSPEFETAYKILEMKIKATNIDPDSIPTDVISYLATNFSSDVRKMEGALNRLLFYSINFSEDGAITLETAKMAFDDNSSSPKSREELSVKDVITAVADYYGLNRSQLASKNRTKNIANARHIAMYLCRKHVDASYVKIGNELGGRDHSTVLSGCEKIDKLVKDNEVYRKVIDDIEKKMFK